ncbi:MAG: YfhO family protein [Ferruginibacter sp.]
MFLYLVFTGGYPAFFIITLYLLVALSLFAFFSSTHKKEFVRKLVIPFGLLSGVFILLSLPAIISFVNHLQYIDRGKKQGLDFVLENSMPPACMFSLISPFSTTAPSPFFNTDILMRNIYTGIVPLVFLINGLLDKAIRKNKELRFFLLTAFILFGLAWGSHFFLRQFVYYTLPLMDTFRHPALFRFFGVIFFLLSAGFSINEWSKKTSKIGQIRKIITTILIIVFLISLFIILFPAAKLVPANFTMSQLKNLVPSLNFQQRFLIQFPFITGTVCIFYFVVSKTKKLFFIGLLSITDLFFATQLNMPITIIGARSFTATELLINRNPARFPLPVNTTIEQNASHSIDSTNTIGSVLPFEKSIGRNDYYITPGNLSLQETFYESSIKDQVFKNKLLYFADTILRAGSDLNPKELKHYSFAIIPPMANSVTGTHFSTDTIMIKKLSANTLQCTTETTTPRLLICLQNIYPGWKVFIDGNETTILTANISFMGVNIPAGKHAILFSYHPAWIICAWYISLFTLICTGIFLFRNILRSRFLLN